MKIYAPLAIALMVTAGASAQTCIGNPTLSGPYVLLASRMLPTAAPAVSVPSNTPYSATPIGQLIKAASGYAPFAASARVVADGAGLLFAAAPDAQYYTARVGAYTVNGDCTVSLRLNDGHLGGLDLLGSALIGAVVPFQGVATDRGTEIDLVQSGSGSQTFIQLVRPYLAAGCSNANLSGPLGVYLTGTDTGTADNPTLAPFSLIARLASDGAGVFYSDTPGLESPLQKLQITGTYKIQTDCTGTAKFVQDGVTRNVQVIVAQGAVSFGQIARPSARLVFSDGRIVATGEAH